MKKISLLLCGMLISIFAFAQTLSTNIPQVVSSGNSGQQILPFDYSGNAASSLDFGLITSNGVTLYQTFINDNEDGSYFLNSPFSFFPGSHDFSIYHRDVNSFATPDFHKTGTAGTLPNRNVTLEKRNGGGVAVFSETYVTSTDDFGLKTIGTDAQEGALTIAARQSSAPDLFQLVAIKTNGVGDIVWETVIPLENVAHDLIFQGVDDDGEFITDITPTPPVSFVKETNDGGYIIVNPNKNYFPPGVTEQSYNFIKLNGVGDFLWSNNFAVPLREGEVGSGPSLSRTRYSGLLTSVEGTIDGSVYFTFSSSNDVNPNAQFRQLDNTGTIVQSFSTSWSLNGNISFFIKELNNRIYWVKLSEIFENNGPPTLVNDFAIFDITDGITNVEAVTNPVAILPPTPNTTFIPLDLILTEGGDFLVTGTEYTDGVYAEEVEADDTPRRPFVVLLENSGDPSAGLVDLEITMTTEDQDVGIYEYITLDLTVTNTGQSDATSVYIGLNGQSGEVVAAGGFPTVASQGSFSSAGAGGGWSIDNVAAGQTETLSVTFFTLVENPSFCAEVISVVEEDEDSSPSNNVNCSTPLEDDEAVVNIGQQTSSGTISGTVFMDDNRTGGQNCSGGLPCTFVAGIQIDLYTQGTNILIATAVSQANGTYIFTNVPPGEYTLEYEYQNDLVPTPFFNGSSAFEFRNNFLDISGETPYIGVGINNNSTDAVRNLGLVDGTQCTLEDLYVETVCDNNGTPNNPNDDTFTVNFRADGQGRASYSLNNSSGQLTGNVITYSESFELLGPFSTSQLPVTLTIDNLGNLPNVSCSLSETITDVDCGNTGGDCEITFPDSGISFGSCNNNGTPNDSSDDFFTVSVTPVTTSASGNFSLVTQTINTNGTIVNNTEIYPSGTTVTKTFNIEDAQAALASVNSVSFVASDTSDPTCTSSVSFGIPNVCSSPANGNVDLELTASAVVPSIYQNGQATFTLTNNGTATSTGSTVEFNKNATLSITATPVVSQGSPQVHWTNTPRWVVGSLAAGQSATITFNIFALSNDVSFFGQVSAQNETDSDSTPNNGNGTTAVEDDETVYPGGGIVAPGFQFTCATNINPALPVSVDQNNDYFGRIVTWNLPTATTDCPGGVTIEQTSGLPSGSYFNVWQEYFIIYTISDACGNEETCYFELQVLGVTGFLDCPDDITVNATSPNGANVTFADAVPVTSCNAFPSGPDNGELQSGDLFPIGTTEVDFSVFFSGSNAFCQNNYICTMTVTVLPEDGGGNDGVDLELVANGNVPTIYQTSMAEFTVTNTGNATATGIVLGFSKNNTVNIINTPIATQGTPQLHWTNNPMWNVGTLAAGASATITFPVFTLSDDVNFYGQVMAQNEIDADSAPNNGNGATPIEDDEASYGGDDNVSGSNACNLSIEVGTVSCSTAGTPNDPNDDTYSFTFTVFGQTDNNTAFINSNVNTPTIVNLSQPYTVTGILANEPHAVLTALAPNNSNCQSAVTINPPGTCGQSITGDEGNNAFNANETAALSATLYPTPTYGDLTVEVYTETAKATQFFIRDTNGRVIDARDLAAQKGKQSVQVSTGSWTNGVYFLQLFNGEKMQTYRFVKL